MQNEKLYNKNVPLIELNQCVCFILKVWTEIANNPKYNWTNYLQIETLTRKHIFKT